jgi:hypothetical protein
VPQPSYTGIGSRRTPADVLATIEEIASGYAHSGWTLRTGGSPGADQAFLRGAIAAGGAAEVYLPWPGFESDELEGLASVAHMRIGDAPPTCTALALAARFHPGWESLDAGARALLARDGHEVLGEDLATPVRFVLCWTLDGSKDGAGLLDDGTGQALRIAHAQKIPVFNLR